MTTSRDQDKARVLLNLSDFSHLVRGGVIETPYCSVALEDMGLSAMMKQVNDAVYDLETAGNRKQLNGPAQ